MKRIILIIISIFALSISYAIGQTHNEATTEDTIKPFLTKMYNDKLYEDYDFLQKHCSPELLKKLQDAGQSEMLPYKTIDDSRRPTLIICNGDAGSCGAEV